MKIAYEVSIATLIQFMALSILNIANGLNSIVTTCVDTGSDCVSNLFASIIFFLLLTAWFGFIVFLGYMTESKRSKRFAQALILAELLVMMIAYFNARHHPDKFSLFISLLDLVLAAWIIFLSFRIMRNPGKRLAKPRTRQRRRAI